MNPDFLADQLQVLEPLEFVRLWAPGEKPDQYVLLLELVREEDDEESAAANTFTVRVVDADEELQGALAALGFEHGECRLTDPESGEDVAALTRKVLAIVRPDDRTLSLTHGSPEEMARRCRLEAVATRVRELLGEEATLLNRPHRAEFPVQFRADSVQVTMWPKDSPPDTILEIWALVASALTDNEEIGVLVSRCNEGFSYGRLQRQDRLLWYRDIIHADPLSESAFNFALRIAVSTVKHYGPRFAELGGKDESVTEPTPAGLPAQPPTAGITRSTLGYL